MVLPLLVLTGALLLLVHGAPVEPQSIDDILFHGKEPTTLRPTTTTPMPAYKKIKIYCNRICLTDPSKGGTLCHCDSVSCANRCLILLGFNIPNFLNSHQSTIAFSRHPFRQWTRKLESSKWDCRWAVAFTEFFPLRLSMMILWWFSDSPRAHYCLGQPGRSDSWSRSSSSTAALTLAA